MFNIVLSSLKIIQISHTFPPYVGGLSHVIYMLSKALAKKHSVEVLTFDLSGNLPKEEEVDGVTVKRFRGYAPSNAYFFPSVEILSYLRSVRADVIHAHNIGSLLVPASSYVIHKRKNCELFVVSPHHHSSGMLWHTKMFWIPYKPLAGKVIRKADVVHCVSNFEAELVAKDFKVKPVVVENGVDDEIYKYSWDSSHALNGDLITATFVGRLEKYKRADMVLRACAILAKQGVKVRANIVGEGPEIGSLKEDADKLGVDARFLSNLTQDELFELYAESSCLVNPSMYEAFSLVSAEALAIGLPVVVVKPWGQIFGEYPRAMVVEPEDESLAEGIISSRTLGVNPMKHVLTWSEVADNLFSYVYSRPS